MRNINNRIAKLHNFFQPGECPACGWKAGAPVPTDPNDLLPFMPEDDLRVLTDILRDAEALKASGALPFGPGRNRARNEAAAARREAEDVRPDQVADNEGGQ